MLDRILIGRSRGVVDPGDIVVDRYGFHRVPDGISRDVLHGVVFHLNILIGPLERPVNIRDVGEIGVATGHGLRVEQETAHSGNDDLHYESYDGILSAF